MLKNKWQLAYHWLRFCRHEQKHMENAVLTMCEPCNSLAARQVCDHCLVFKYARLLVRLLNVAAANFFYIIVSSSQATYSHNTNQVKTPNVLSNCFHTELSLSWAHCDSSQTDRHSKTGFNVSTYVVSQGYLYYCGRAPTKEFECINDYFAPASSDTLLWPLIAPCCINQLNDTMAFPGVPLLDFVGFEVTGLFFQGAPPIVVNCTALDCGHGVAGLQTISPPNCDNSAQVTTNYLRTCFNVGFYFVALVLVPLGSVIYARRVHEPSLWYGPFLYILPFVALTPLVTSRYGDINKWILGRRVFDIVWTPIVSLASAVFAL